MLDGAHVDTWGALVALVSKIDLLSHFGRIRVSKEVSMCSVLERS